MRNPDSKRFALDIILNCSAFFAGIFAFSAVKKKLTRLRKTFNLILLLLSISINLLSQERQLSESIISIAEELAENETDPEAAGIYVEKLYDLATKPVRLNNGDETDLSRLFFLTDFQIKALADYVRTSGKIYSVFEITNIPGFDREQAEMMIPFISLEPGSQPVAISKRLNNTFLTNFSFKFPPSESDTTGPPWKLLSKYKFTAGRFTGGFTSEKDFGEKLFPGRPPLPDFLTAYLSCTGTGVIRKVIIGDYGGRFGMGTNINTGLRSGLSLTASGYLSGGDDLRPYTSTDENNFFRGAAVQFQVKRIGLSLFCSLNKIDATVDSAGNGSAASIATFYRTGLHTTPSFLEKRDVVSEKNYGINLSFNLDKVKAGLLWTGTGFSIPYYPDTHDPEAIYDFTGQGNNILSVYYKAVLGRMIIFGEGSYGSGRKSALVQGFSLRPSDRLNINILARSYAPGFSSFHGKGPFSGSAGENVIGLFANFTFEAAKHLFLSAGCDLRYYPWLKYRCSAPSLAKSGEIRIKYLPSETMVFEASWNYRFTMLNVTESAGIRKQEEIISRTIKGSFKYYLSEKVIFGTRVDFRITGPSGSTGMLMLQDINYRLDKIPLSIWFRYCIFRTDDWDSRIYTYENDLVYNFGIPALSGTGTRSYLMAEWSPGKSADVRIKYAFTEKREENAITNESRELKVQLRLWF